MLFCLLTMPFSLPKLVDLCVETCKKLGISAYRFIFDRVSKTFELPSLAELIRAKANPHLIYDDTS